MTDTISTNAIEIDGLCEPPCGPAPCTRRASVVYRETPVCRLDECIPDHWAFCPSCETVICIVANCAGFAKHDSIICGFEAEVEEHASSRLTWAECTEHKGNFWAREGGHGCPRCTEMWSV